MTATFPRDVRGFDWTAAPMAGPPEERIQTGYHRWYDTNDEVARGRDYYVLPDGGAEIVHLVDGVVDEVETLPAGAWRVVYPTFSTFGSRGGCWVERVE